LKTEEIRPAPLFLEVELEYDPVEIGGRRVNSEVRIVLTK
jgi:hypothetical protein